MKFGISSNMTWHRAPVTEAAGAGRIVLGLEDLTPENYRSVLERTARVMGFT